MAKPNPTPDQHQVLIHDLIIGVQSSLDIAEETARKHYSFSVAELEVTASFDFEMAEQDDDVPETKPQPKRWFSLFGGKKEAPVHMRSHNMSEKDSSKLTVRMLFKPGGKLLVSSTTAGAEGSSSPPADSGSSTPAADAAPASPPADAPAASPT